MEHERGAVVAGDQRRARGTTRSTSGSYERGPVLHRARRSIGLHYLRSHQHSAQNHRIRTAGHRWYVSCVIPTFYGVHQDLSLLS